MPIHPDELRNIEDRISAGEKRLSEQEDRVRGLSRKAQTLPLQGKCSWSCKALKAYLSADATCFCGKFSRTPNL